MPDGHDNSQGLDYLDAITTESDRFAAAATRLSAVDGGLDTTVPSCPDWSGADLIWHLTEVQHFWTTIVVDRPATPDAVAPLDRPADDELLDLFTAGAAALRQAVEAADVSDECWSWHPRGHNVGWVRRRQANEALIHRIDADLTTEAAGAGSGDAIDERLAADGVDELLTMMLDAGDPPVTGRFDPSSSTARLVAGPSSWDFRLGRYRSDEGPDGPIDAEAIQVVDRIDEPSVVITAEPSELDLWLWRRAPLPAGAVAGDQAVADELYALCDIR